MRLGLIVAIGASLVIAFAAGGCYERVVGVEGPGASSYDVYEPNLKTKEDSSSKRPGSVPNKTVPTKKAKD